MKFENIKKKLLGRIDKETFKAFEEYVLDKYKPTEIKACEGNSIKFSAHMVDLKRSPGEKMLAVEFFLNEKRYSFKNYIKNSDINNIDSLAKFMYENLTQAIIRELIDSNCLKFHHTV